jgi:dethiobiotin synthetase
MSLGQPTSPPGAVILGTDTSAGKTTFACALLRLAHRLSLRPVPHKPVETGCSPEPNDSLRLLLASHNPAIRLRDVCPIQLASPVAPAVAASAAGLSLILSDLATTALGFASGGNFLVVETAGGLLSPYGPRFTSADLAAALHLPIVLVAPNRLGTINHTCLALSELARRQLPVAALVLVDTTPEPTPDRPHNAALIAAQTGVLPLATLPFVPDLDPEHLADALAAQVPPADLFSRLGVLAPPSLPAR